MNNIKQLEKKQEKIKKEIYDFAEAVGLSNPHLQPITDGIFNAKKYLEKENLKIMWILKEPYDSFDKKGNPKGGDWDITDFHFSNPIDFSTNNTFGRKITYVSYALLNQKEWEVLSKTKDDNEMAFANQHIAYININKMPNKKISNDKELFQNYAIWKEILWKQIDTYEPDIMIFGNTFKFFKADFDGRIQGFKHKSYVDSYLCDNQLLISTYHPSATINEEEYTKNIIYIVKRWNDYKSSHIESSEQKYILLATIAKFLCENKLTMTGEELSGILNRKGITRKDGTSYCGGRGIYTLIRNCYKYFDEKGEKQKKNFIKTAFVKKNGNYAYL